MTARLRVLQLAWEYPPLVYGGLARHVHGLATGLVGLGHEVTVVTQAAAGRAGSRVEDGVTVLRADPGPLPELPRSELLGWVATLQHALARTGLHALRHSGFDVLHAHDWVVGEAAATLGAAGDLPLVATVHATEAGRHQGYLPGPLSRAVHTREWWLTAQARRVIACSPAAAAELTRLHAVEPPRLAVVPNAVHAADWTPASTQRSPTPLLVCAGRLEYEKGQHVLLRALPRLRRRHPGLRLVLAGEGTHEPELRDLASRLRLGRSVQFAGRLDGRELSALLGRAWVAVLPSLYEPFGLGALEAAAAGTARVASQVGGLAGLVEPGVDGLLATPGDVDALAAALHLLLADAGLRQRLAAAGRDRIAAGPGWPGVAAATAQVYREAVLAPVPLVAGAAPEPPEGRLLPGP